MDHTINHFIAELRKAIAEDRAAKLEALQRGLDATQPLTLVRLSELCALGDRMAHTTVRRGMAVTGLCKALGVIP
jgi:hypothetical protein